MLEREDREDAEQDEEASSSTHERLNEILSREGVEREDVSRELQISEDSLVSAKGSVAAGWKSRRDSLKEAAHLLEVMCHHAQFSGLASAFPGLWSESFDVTYVNNCHLPHKELDREDRGSSNATRLNAILADEGLRCEEVGRELQIAEEALKKAKGSVVAGWKLRRDALAEAALLLNLSNGNGKVRP